MADEDVDLEQDDKEEPEAKAEGKDDAGDDKDQEDLADLINVEDFVDAKEGEEEPEKKAAEGKDKGKGKAADRQAPTVEQERDELLRKNKELNRALHEARQTRKAEKGDDGKPVLTDQQLVAIMEQYKDDPTTLLNVIAHKAQEAAKQAAKQTVDDADTIKRRKETEEYIYEKYPDLLKDDSDLRKHVNKTKAELGIEDHPYGELFGTAVTSLMAMPQLLKSAYEKGKSDAEAGIADKNRKKEANEKNLAPKGKPAGETKIAPDTRDVAERLGLKSPRQIALLNKLTASAKGARTVSVEG